MNNIFRSNPQLEQSKSLTEVVLLLHLYFFKLLPWSIIIGAPLPNQYTQQKDLIRTEITKMMGMERVQNTLFPKKSKSKKTYLLQFFILHLAGMMNMKYSYRQGNGVPRKWNKQELWERYQNELDSDIRILYCLYGVLTNNISKDMLDIEFQHYEADVEKNKSRSLLNRIYMSFLYELTPRCQPGIYYIN